MSGAQRHTEPLDVHLIAVRDGAAGPEVLMSRRADDVYAAGWWPLVSGHLDGPWEDMVAALVREAREESGVVVDPADLRAAVTVHHRSPAGDGKIGVFFEVRRWKGTPEVMEPDVCDAMGWFSFDALPEPMVAYCRAGLDAYRSGARMAVHFQEPGDPIAYDRSVDRLILIPGPRGRGAVPERAVRAFVEQAVGRVTAWTDVSWVREESRVWRAGGAEGGEWYVKIHQNDRFHHREVDALRSWVPGLGAAGPRLVAADPALRAVVLTAVGGRTLHGAVHPPEQQRRIFHRIGRLAASIHHSTPPRPAADNLPLARLERHLAGALPHLAPGDEEFIRATAERSTGLAPVEIVPTHGDFQLRNLRWDERAEDLYVIDFERSEPGPAVRDFVRLSDAWHGRPDLFQALLDGYGRRFQPEEEAQFTVLSVLDAVSGIAYGTAHGDPELVERGLRTLTRLRTEQRP
ncbi:MULTISPECIES: phosphotransferase [unclassified Streptomyces]|uniref:phosphotransferase n=1 Tax=unclassified Streptomyces TaxID=2593676 RepID=UPI000CD58066|nr:MULTISPECIES: phosphotransferase [unclassified Streptomyces]AWL42248.1 NUDIX domain-containing protein [Streptomyces sp. SM18]